MDDLAVDEEKKPFDELGGHNEDDSQPDPDEHIMLESGQGRVWLVKIPKFLMERWSKFDAEGVQLAKIRIYDVPPGAAPRIVVLVPSDDGEGDDIYELDMVNQDVHNQVVVAERAKAPTGTGRARTTIMTGKVKHECNLRPRMTGRYERRLTARGAAAKNEKAVRVGLMDGARAGRGGGKMLSSGISSAAGFADLTRTKVKPQKGQYERMARMPRNQLLDSLFSLFREREQWPIKLLREKTQQPEVYLKEVLSEIATLHRSGEFNGTWELMPSFKGDGVRGYIKAEGMSQLYASQPSNADVSMDDYDEEEEDDDDMEEVME
ncbi:transcription initiation factor IIF, beta subunit-domain-containing protein [Lactarius akahatsu]|uniref:Transcription initiation factor IIF subunit beta n=1 Tax=Lactarius akahatsu TaxID=416441 RepID=A0AAD4Q7Y5_9AGAM|nr:transcription initiation factor IIF, beta subunit-domain-containing protein [Lactarius akahatsu]